MWYFLLTITSKTASLHNRDSIRLPYNVDRTNVWYIRYGVLLFTHKEIDETDRRIIVLNTQSGNTVHYRLRLDGIYRNRYSEGRRSCGVVHQKNLYEDYSIR
uniref:Uncharacterized protein n=1 Tax=Hyaloperonospora arabidopsidis (strain Emoy2) TaxID=559515 RepID=M4C2A1_HYAAE